VNRRGLLFITVGLVAAIAAGAMVYLLATNIGRTAAQTTAGPAATTPVPGIEVLVAATDIEANTVLTNSMIVTATFPTDLVPSDALRNPAEVVGTTARIKVFGGQMLFQRQFIQGQGRVGSSVNIPKGKVLSAFPSTDILNSTGAVQPGDHVDILLTLPISGTVRLDAGAQSEAQTQLGARALVSQGTLQNIEVYSTGQWSPPGGTDTAHTGNLKIITFIVDHQEALILKFVKDSGGTIDLVVRSLEENTEVETDPVNLDYLVDLYRFIGLPGQNP
jgi:pilus assembly protein CpaB